MRVRPWRSFYLIWLLKLLVSNSCGFHFPSFLYSGDSSAARCSLIMTAAPPSGLWPAGSVLICFLEPASPTGLSPFSPAPVLSSLPSPWKGNLLPYKYQFGHHHFFFFFVPEYCLIPYPLTPGLTTPLTQWQGNTPCLGEKHKDNPTQNFLFSFALKFFCSPQSSATPFSNQYLFIFTSFSIDLGVGL